jgi:hypothetical protein
MSPSLATVVFLVIFAASEWTFSDSLIIKAEANVYKEPRLARLRLKVFSDHIKEVLVLGVSFCNTRGKTIPRLFSHQYLDKTILFYHWQTRPTVEGVVFF